MAESRITVRAQFELLEPRRLLADFAATINFQPADVGPVEFTRADFGRPLAERGNGLTYGWSRDLEAAGDMIDRDSERDLVGLSFGGRSGNGPEDESQEVDERFDTFARVDAGDSWSIEVPNGTYAVNLVSGDADFQGDIGEQLHLWDVNGSRAMRALPVAHHPWGESLVYIEVTDGLITLTAGEGGRENSLSWVRIAGIPDRPVYTQGQAISWNILGDELLSPVRRAEGSSAVVDGKLYTIGGFGENYETVHQRMDILDIETLQWSQGADLPDGAAETHTAIAADAGRGHIYWISGQIGTGESGQSYQTTPAVWRYVVAENRWERFVDLPESRFAGGAAIVDDYLYFFGGDDETRVLARGDTWRIHLGTPAADTDQDGVPDSPAWETRALMLAPVDHLSPEVLDGRIYVTGGEYGHGVGYVQRAELQIYDPETDTWSLGAPLPTPSSHSRALAHDGRIWVFGGQREAQIVLNEVRSYDPVQDLWQLHDPMPHTRKAGFVFMKDDAFYYVAGDAFSEGFPRSVLIGELA